MEKAALKTLIYADFFDFPLKAWEIQKWLIEKPLGLQDVEKTLNRLSKKSRVQSKNSYYFLRGREKIMGIRLRKEKISNKYLKKAKFVAEIFKIIPWVKLVGISGGLALGNAGKSDDIDFFVVTSKDRLWLCRLLMLGILSALGIRRKSSDKIRSAAGKICLNLILEEDVLEQEKKDLYTAHEVLQMKPLWQRDGVYDRYLDVNSWVFKYLPSWGTSSKYQVASRKGKKNFTTLSNVLEVIAKKCQLNLMSKPKGVEKITNGAVYFHPIDYGKMVLQNYKKKVKRF